MLTRIMFKGDIVHAPGDLRVVTFHENGDVVPGVGSDFLLPYNEWVEMGRPVQLELTIGVPE